MPSLPIVALTWTAEDTLVAAGHDCQPYVFSGASGTWSAVGTLDDPSGASSRNSNLPTSPVGRLKTGAFATFRDADSRGQSSLGSAGPGGASSNDTKLLTLHQNTITSVRPYEVAGGVVTKVSTSGVDGQLVIWDVNEVSALTGKMGAMSI
jgi:actin related protein 2/3 complex, subunit 1A/1B